MTLEEAMEHSAMSVADLAMALRTVGDKVIRRALAGHPIPGPDAQKIHMYYAKRFGHSQKQDQGKDFQIDGIETIE